MSSQNQIIQAIIAFLNAGSWEESKHIVETHQTVLLTPSGEVGQLFDVLLAQYQDDENVTRMIKEHRDILVRCQREGIEAAFAGRTGGTRSPALNALIDEINSLTRSQDIPRRIQAYQEALRLVDRTTQPEFWAALQVDLANSMSQNRLGNRADDLEQAISHYLQALQVYTRQAFPEKWAMIQNNLANAYAERIRGARATNIQQAILHYQQALKVYTRQASPLEWAMTRSNLANSYLHRIRGKRAENLEQAIFYFQQTLQIYTRQALPVKWASTQNNLATAYLARIRGERAENIEQAISHLQQALQVYTSQASPYDWAAIQSNLGQAYNNRIRGDQAENIEQAISHYLQALQVYTRQAFPAEWAAIQSNLANAYSERIRGEGAAIQSNLANAYSERIRGEGAENLEQAISYLQQALEVYTRQAFPVEWARIQNNLANAYAERICGQRAENIEQAIWYYTQALQVYPPQAFPVKWASTLNNLANAYQYRIRGEQAENLERAIDYYQQALQVRTRQAMPMEWAETQNNLATAYANRTHGERAENIEQAISHYQQVLEVRTPQSFPQGCRDTAYRVGCLLYDQKRFAEARDALMIAHQAVEALRSQVQRETGKRDLSQENADLYAKLVHCCLREGDKVAAFEYAMASKGRTLVDSLASGGFLNAMNNNPALANDPTLIPYRSLAQEIDHIRITLNSENISYRDQQTLHREFETRQKEQNTLWEELIFKYRTLTITQQAPRFTADQARQLAHELQATLIEYVHHAAGWSAFVVTKDTIQYVPLDEVDEVLLSRTTRWIKNIESKKRVSFGKRITRKRLVSIYAALIAPLQAHLPPTGQGKRLILAPFGLLHQLPLNAAQNSDTLSYLCQDYTVTFTPNLAALRTLLDQAHQADWQFSQPKHSLHVAYSGPPNIRKHMQKSGELAVEMAKMFSDVKPLFEEEATIQATAANVRDRELIHFSGYGIFEPDYPDQSGLLLYDGFLTVRRIMTDLDLSQSDLIVLATGRSGRQYVGEGEELVGLVQAMLIAGAKMVVASLWRIDETPTQVFFHHFYSAINDSYSPAEALTHAAQKIRQTEGWEHPYYWAAFQISGLAHTPLLTHSTAE